MESLPEHSFVVPVYGKAPNLAALIESLRAQIAPRSEILLATSTPSDGIETFAKRNDLPLHVNPQRAGIAADWNFALAAARASLVTLAHQDDLFERAYTARLIEALRRQPTALFAFCDYTEHTAFGARPVNANLRIKRALCHRAFKGRECLTEPRDKLRLLSLGNPICCPSVMFNRATLAEFSFPTGFSTNLDWMAWLDLARRPGGFVYARERLVSKGIHAGSETTATIASRARWREDRAIFNSLWPRPIAAALAAVYTLGYRTNRVHNSDLTQPDAGHPQRYQEDAEPLQR